MNGDASELWLAAIGCLFFLVFPATTLACALLGEWGGALATGVPQVLLWGGLFIERRGQMGPAPLPPTGKED